MTNELTAPAARLALLGLSLASIEWTNRQNGATARIGGHFCRYSNGRFSVRGQSTVSLARAVAILTA